MTTRKPVLGMVLKGYPRISETFISNEIRLLEEMGLCVRIISMRKPRESFSHASVKRIKAQVIYLPENMLPHLHSLLYHNAVLFLQKPGTYLKAFAYMVSRFLKVRRSATIKHLLQGGYLVRVAGNGGLAHLHAHFAHSPTSVALYAGMLAGLPVSFTGHAKDVYTQDPERLAEKVNEAAFVVTCTGHNKEYLDRLAPDAAIFKVYHGIDLSLFVPGEPRFSPKPPFAILSVARLTAKKGLANVLRALAVLAGEGVDFTYELVGEGEDKAMLKELAASLGIADKVRFLGAMPHEAVLTHYRRADAFVLGCRVLDNGDRDGIPNVLVEAMAMGVPCAATTVSAIPELITDGETGLLTPPDDPGAMAGALRRLLTDEALRRRMIPAAMARVREGFDNAGHIRELGRIFMERAGNPPGIFANGSRP
mgnify:FL=1